MPPPAAVPAALATTEPEAPAPEIPLAPLPAEFAEPTSAAQALAPPTTEDFPAGSPGRGGVPPWSVGAALAAGLLVGVGVGWVISPSAPDSTPQVAASASVAPPPTPEPPPSAEPPPPPTLLERVAAGDEKALGELEAKDNGERTADEVLALGRGRIVRSAREVKKLAKKIQADSALLDDAEIRKQLKTYAKDRSVADIALRILATTDNAKGADLLYHIWVRTPKRTPTTQLAEELLYSKEVRPKVSPALAIALDLRKAEDCEENAAIVKRAIEEGDRRSLHLLGKRTMKSGCGEKKNKDCYPCLRQGKELKEALQAVVKRAPPNL